MGAALSFVLLYLGYSTAVFDMSASVICGVITVIIAYEAGVRLTTCAIAVCTFLCAVFIEDKTVFVLYLTVGGIYPLVKPLAERFYGPRRIVLKLISAVCAVGLYVASFYIFIPAETGRYLIPIALTAGVFCFFLYDVLLTRAFILYIRRFRGKLIK